MYEQINKPYEKVLCKVAQCAGCVLAISRPHQLHWCDWEMGTAISCMNCMYVAIKCTEQFCVCTCRCHFTYSHVVCYESYQLTTSINTYTPCTQTGLFRYTSSPGPGSLSLFFYVHSVYLTPSFSNINHQYILATVLYCTLCINTHSTVASISHSTVLYFVYKHSQYSCLHSHKERGSSGHDWPPSDRRCPQSRLDTCR